MLSQLHKTSAAGRLLHREQGPGPPEADGRIGAGTIRQPSGVTSTTRHRGGAQVQVEGLLELAHADEYRELGPVEDGLRPMTLSASFTDASRGTVPVR